MGIDAALRFAEGALPWMSARDAQSGNVRGKRRMQSGGGGTIELFRGAIFLWTADIGFSRPKRGAGVNGSHPIYAMIWADRRPTVHSADCMLMAPCVPQRVGPFYSVVGVLFINDCANC